GNWLSVGQSGGFVSTQITGTTSSPLGIYLNTNNVPTTIGTYSGQVRIANPSNSNDFVTVNVSLSVTISSGGSGSAASPSSFNFTTSPGVVPATQYLTVQVPAGQSFTTTINGTNFFSSPCNNCSYTNSQNLPITINPGGLGIGTYNTYIILTSGGTQF